MGWFNDSYQFDSRLLLLTLSLRQASIEGLQSALSYAQGDPGQLELWVKALIRIHHPELAEAVIINMQFDPALCVWRFLVSHGSLTPVADGELPPTCRLISKET